MVHSRFIGKISTAFIPGEKTPHPYLLDRRLDGPQSRSERGSDEENSLSLPGIEDRSSSP
jgi:hypothetical protein